MKEIFATGKDYVHCRTGSLENLCRQKRRRLDVHCRTGSLENVPMSLPANNGVHCRTGSLERAFSPADSVRVFTAAQAA